MCEGIAAAIALDRLTFHGFDAPREGAGAASPGRYLAHVGDFLGCDRSADIDDLTGDEARWSDPSAIWEPGPTIGRSAEAQRLRVIPRRLPAQPGPGPSRVREAVRLAPKDFEDHRDEFAFARLDTVMPHPGYALHGFGSIVMPGPHMVPEIDRLLAVAHARAVDRHERASRRTADHQG